MSAVSNATFAPICSGQNLRAGMRVVIFEKDAAIRQRVARAFTQDAAFLVVGVAERMSEADELIDRFVPEVVIFPAEDAVSRPLAQSETLFLHTCSRNGELVLRRVDADCDYSLNCAHLTRSLAAIESEILSRKIKWLRHLVSSVSSTPNPSTGKARVALSPLTDRQPGDVAWVRAKGNYVLFHGIAGTWRERGTLAMLGGSDSNCQFLRISRSCAVNRAHIQHVLKHENHLVIAMKCGAILRPSRSYLQLILQTLPDLIQSQSS